MAAYATIEEAQAYFDERLYTDAWDDAEEADKTKALATATRAIDRLNFAGMKSAAYAVYLNNSCDWEAIWAAGATQELQFPRGTDTVVPDDIKIACYEEVLLLLDGKDPEKEFDRLKVLSETYAGVRATYDRSRLPENLLAGIVSSTAWKYLRPYLRDPSAVFTSRVS